MPVDITTLASEIQSQEAERHDLYCLNVHDVHAVAVNDGIIVSNCWDCLRYRVNLRIGGAMASDVFA